MGEHPAAGYHAKRRDETREKIISGAKQVLESGDLITVENVSKKSGVAKTTVYRFVEGMGYSRQDAAVYLRLLLISSDKDILRGVGDQLIGALREVIKDAQTPTEADAGNEAKPPVLDPEFDVDDILRMMVPVITLRLLQDDLPPKEESSDIASSDDEDVIGS